jgi:hypothetical protein
MGQSYPVEWTTGNLGGTVTIQLKKGSSIVYTVTTTAENDGLHQCSVPTNLTPGSDYRIYVVSNVNSSEYGNSEYFSIISNDPILHLNIISPTGSSVWTIGQSYPVEWTTGNLGGTVTIQLKKGSTIVYTVTTTAENDGLHQCSVPTNLTPGSDYRIYVGSNVNPSEYGNSEYFQINY